MIDFNKVKNQLINHEGREYKAYQDSKGYWTIGIGHCIDRKITGDIYSEEHFREHGITDLEIGNLFQKDLTNVVIQLDRHIPWWKQLDEIRQRVLIDMTFNLGIGNLLAFKQFLIHLSDFQFSAAADEMMWVDATKKIKFSPWYIEVGRRAERLTRWMKTGIEDWM